MEKYEELELQVISFEVDDVLENTRAVAARGSGQVVIVPGNNNPAPNP